MTLKLAILSRPDDVIASALHDVLAKAVAPGDVTLHGCLTSNWDVLLNEVRAAALGADAVLIVDCEGDVRRNLLIGIFIRIRCRTRALLVDSRSNSSGCGDVSLPARLSWPVSLSELFTCVRLGPTESAASDRDADLAELILSINWHNLRHELRGQRDARSVRQFVKLISQHFHGNAVQRIMGDVWIRLHECGRNVVDEMNAGAPADQCESFLEWHARHAELCSTFNTIHKITKG